MKNLLFSITALFVIAVAPSALAIDNILHDVADHTIGRGQHQRYYTRGGSDHGRSRYGQTRNSWSGGHRNHHNRAVGVFGVGRGHDNRRNGHDDRRNGHDEHGNGHDDNGH